MIQAAWRCRHGFHAWSTERIDTRWTPQIPGHGPDPYWRVTEKCRRCPVIRKRTAHRRPRWRTR